MGAQGPRRRKKKKKKKKKKKDEEEKEEEEEKDEDEDEEEKDEDEEEEERERRERWGSEWGVVRSYGSRGGERWPWGKWKTGWEERARRRYEGVRTVII